MKLAATSENRKRKSPASSSVPFFVPQGCVVNLKGTVDCPVGYLWREGRKHWFTYLPAYLASPTAVPLHPTDLPLTFGVVDSDGEDLDGRLAIFGACRPAKESEIATEVLLETTFGTPANGLTNTPIGSLAGASLLAGRKGINGLNFDYSGWPDRVMKPVDRAFWRGDDFVMPRSKARVALEKMGCPRWVANSPQRFRPSPIEGLAVEANRREGFICIGYQVEHCVRQRVEAAYLKIASRCGLSVTRHRRLADGPFSLFWRDEQNMFSAPLGGDRPEEIAARANGLINRNHIAGMELYSRLCFLLLGGFSNKAYEEALRIHPRVTVRSRGIVEYVWELAPIKHLAITGIREKGFGSAERRIQRLAEIGRQLNLPDAFIENTMSSVVQQLLSWCGVAEKEGLTVEEIAQYAPTVPDESSRNVSAWVRMREGARYWGIKYGLPG